MKQVFYVMLLAPLFIAGCSGGAFKKTDKGTQYKIIAKGSGEKLKYGEFFEFSFSYRYQDSKKDSLLTSSASSSNSIALLDTVQSNTPGYIYRIFAQCRKGDSVVMKVPIDSAYEGGTIPPGFKKGGFIVTGYRIVKVFKDKAEADSAMNALRTVAQQKAIAKEKETLAKDDKTIADFLAKNKITAVKAPAGTYVQIIAQGNGPLIDTSVEARVNYTGRTMAGKIFDSNTDTSLGRLSPPYPVRMWAPEVIRGWVDGLGLLSKGAKAKFYIPSGLAYGPQSPGGDVIGANEILVFDIEVADVLSKAQSMALQKEEQKKMEQQQKQMMEMRKRYEDSLAKASKDTAKKTK
jgi:FKBP-type peptidyl-prolyl cis-trans isomerase FkpA